MNDRIRDSIQALMLILAWLTVAGCEPNEPEPQIDYSQEGPNGPNAQTEFTETASGLKYRILREGTGKHPAKSETVTISYRGWLDDGTGFESSYLREKPTTLPLGGMINGLKEGLRLIGEGGKIELTIPPDLGYGQEGKSPGIPPDAQLHFIIELHEVAD